jgi:hypothetical protein
MVQGLEQLKKDLAEIDEFVKSDAITEERGKEWKDRIINDFEKTNIPQDMKTTVPQNDLAHLPGQVAGGIIGALGHINGARCAGVEDPPGEDRNGRTQKSQRARSPQELMNNLPEQYR